MKTVWLVGLSIAVLLGVAYRVQNNSPDRSGSDIERPVSSEIADKPARRTESGVGTDKITNIKQSLKFEDAKPGILSIINSERLNLKVIGLKKGQIMPKHKAGLTSLLIMMEGKIEFTIEAKVFELNAFETYEIPVNVEHEIRGVEQSIFALTQEK